MCGKRFYRDKYSTRINPHKRKDSKFQCSGRYGYLVYKPTTTAELVSMFCEAGLVSPLSHDYVVAYAKLFTAVFPAKAEEILPQLPPESYPGRADEIISLLREKFRQER